MRTCRRVNLKSFNGKGEVFIWNKNQQSLLSLDKQKQLYIKIVIGPVLLAGNFNPSIAHVGG